MTTEQVYINFSPKFTPIPEYQPLDFTYFDKFLLQDPLDIDLELLPYSEEIPVVEKIVPKINEKFEKEEKKISPSSSSLYIKNSKSSPTPDFEDDRRKSTSISPMIQINAMENLQKGKDELKRISKGFKQVIDSIKGKNLDKESPPSSISPNGKKRRDSVPMDMEPKTTTQHIMDRKKSLTPTNSPRTPFSHFKNFLLKSNKEEEPFQMTEVEESLEGEVPPPPIPKEKREDHVFPSELGIEERLWYLGLK